MPRRFEDEGRELVATQFPYGPGSHKHGDTLLLTSRPRWWVRKVGGEWIKSPWTSGARIRRFWEINGRWPTEEDKE